MTEPNEGEFLIVHATDLRVDGQRTFDHAFALARDMDARLMTLHITGGEVEMDVPEAREVLERLSSPDADVEHDIVVKEGRKNPRKDLVKMMREQEPDLLIVGTRRQSGGKNPLRRSVSEAAAIKVDIPTLVTHVRQEGVVDGNGHLRIQRVLVPIGDGAEARDTIDGLTRFLDRLEVDDVDLFLLRVGDDDVLEHVLLPQRDGWRWHREHRSRGFVADTIAEVCDEKDVDLVAMATRGQDGFIDVFSGTHTQKVIRRAPRPVLAVSASDKVEPDTPEL